MKIRVLKFAVILFVAALTADICDSKSDDGYTKVVLASDILDMIKRGNTVELNGVVVVGDLDLSGRKLPAITITNSKINGDVDFEEAVFQESANFINTIFSSKVTFRYTQFSGETNFRNAYFISDVDFSGAKFIGYADFLRVQFIGDASYYGAQFSDYVDFGGAKFVGEANFLIAQFDKIGYFNNAYFEKNLNLNNARFYTMRLDNVAFGKESKVLLNESDFTKLYVEWGSIKSHLVYDGAVYLALVKNFKSLEHFEDADDCYYQYRKISQSNKPWGISKLIDYIAWITCGYGTRIENPLIIGIIIILVCTFYYRLTNAIKRHEKDGHIDANTFDALYFSVMTFTIVGYGDWYPTDNHRIVVMLEGILGWLMLSLFLVTLAGVMIRS